MSGRATSAGAAAGTPALSPPALGRELERARVPWPEGPRGEGDAVRRANHAEGREPSISTMARRRRCAGVASTAERGRSPACSAATASARRSLLRAIVGQQPVERGHDPLRRAGHLRACTPTSARGAASRYVPQGREIFPLLTVRENLETGLCPPARATGARSTTRLFDAVPGAEVACSAGAAAISPAASSSSSPSPARW